MTDARIDPVVDLDTLDDDALPVPPPPGPEPLSLPDWDPLPTSTSD